MLGGLMVHYSRFYSDTMPQIWESEQKRIILIYQDIYF